MDRRIISFIVSSSPACSALRSCVNFSRNKSNVDIVSNNQLVESRYRAVDQQMKDGNENTNEMVPVLSINIKPADESTYDNLVTILDEMQICCVGKYVIDNINEKDQALLEAAGVDLSK